MALDTKPFDAKNAPKISDRDFEQLRDYIYNVCGIYFHSSKKYFLESRLARRMEGTGCRTHADYYQYVRSAATGRTELTKLLPEIVAHKSKIGFKKLRIWSAGSSSGEEAYTMAMILLEKRATLLKDWIIEIVGTDINETVLGQAREGVYSSYSVRNTPDFYLKKYFKEEGPGKYLLSPDVKKLASFNQLNLYDDNKMLFMKSFDFIFCANVLIYFDTSSKSKVVQHFYNNLQPYGYFFVGQSESLHGVNDKFKTVHFPGGFTYNK